MRASLVALVLILVGCATTGDGVSDPQGRGRWATDPKVLTRPTAVSAAWVAEHAAECVLFDVRSSADAFAAGHLEGAVHLPTAKLRRSLPDGSTRMLAREELVSLFSDLGVGDGVNVVVYGGDRISDATHTVMALLSIGHPLVAVLEGGVGGWTSSARELSTAITTPSPRSLSLATSLITVATTEQVVLGATALIDARPADQYAKGHIPGALNRPSPDDVVVSDGHWWKSRAELKRAYSELGLTPSMPVTVSCRSGVSATQAWFTLSVLLGYEDVRWHDGSWLAYSSDLSRAIEVGTATRSVKPLEPAVVPSVVVPAFEPTNLPVVPTVLPTPPQMPMRVRYATDPEHLDNPCVVSTGYVAGGARGAIILDTRSKADYTSGHIPGARHLRPSDALFTMRGGIRNLLLSPSGLAVAFGQLGVDLTKPVVFYGDNLEDPCLAALALMATGHRRVAIMEGGLLAWIADRRALTAVSPRSEPSAFAARSQRSPLVADLVDVIAAIETKAATILDVRPTRAFDGIRATRSGHLPKSVNHPNAPNLVSDNGSWWTEREIILSNYAKVGLGPKDPVIALGLDGKDSALAWWTLTVIAGFESVRWYDGGFDEWASDPRRPLEVTPSK